MSDRRDPAASSVLVPARSRAFPTALALAVLLPAGSSCRIVVDPQGEGEGESGEGEGEVGEGEGEVGEGEGETFDDHTRDALASVEEFVAIAEASPSSSAAKFVITRFGRPDARTRFYESDVFSLHDEWYWFRLLNGQRIEGVPTPAVTTSHGPFSSIAEIYDWAKVEVAAGRALPLDLRFLSNEERLYSPLFYELALTNEPRSMGIGTLVHFPATATRDEVWALELEFSDDAGEAELRVFFDELTQVLPAAIADNLKWITRSQAQAAVGAALPDDLRARVISFDDVVEPGQTEVYAPGTTAGRLLVVHPGEEALLETARATDVLVVEEVPDYLPPCAALITGQPQTALAHVNLLARNRGIPNAFRAGIVDDANIEQLGRVRAPVIVRANAETGDLDIVSMSESDFATWRTLTSTPTVELPPIDITGLDDTVDLTTLEQAEANDLRRVIGGKAAGFVALLTSGVTTVDAPMAITIKPYVEHFDATGLTTRLTAMLADTVFKTDVTVRRLVLGGEDAVDAAVVAAFRTARPVGDVLRDLVDAGGVVEVIRSTPLTPSVLSSITDVLHLRFGRYAAKQGLRFRSSSTIEDAAGFNGAGLYESNTGYLDPDDNDPTVEDAVRATWSSYWGYEAFEERRLANIDHLRGAMAVVVHANFPDNMELNNGVAIFSILPSQSQQTTTPRGYVFEVNQQAGAHSVTNPPPGSAELPEIDRVVVDGEGPPRIERVRGSTILLPGDVVLDDDTLLAMFDDAKAITEQWITADNAELVASKRRSTLTLDFETRTVKAGWPALRSGVQLPSRLVWKQARPLEPGSRVADDVSSQPIPIDLLPRTRRVVRQLCAGDGLQASYTAVFTDPAIAPDMGFSVDPFVAFVVVDFIDAAPELGAVAGTRRTAIHTAFRAGFTDEDFVVDVAPERQAGLKLERVSIPRDGAGTIDVRFGESIAVEAVCASTTTWAGAADFLDGLLAVTE